MAWIKYTKKEWDIIWWSIFVLMLIYLAYSIVVLINVGAIEYCVSFNETFECFKNESDAYAYADSLPYPINEGHKYINNNNKLEAWDKFNLSRTKIR